VLATPDADSGAAAPPTTRALGIGALLVGTASLGPRVAASDEAGERWVRRVQVRPVPTSRVPSVYLTWFPAFAAHVDVVGAAAWETFVTSHVCRGRRAVSMRRLEIHARLYFRRMRLAARRPLTREHLPFDRDVFLRAHRDTDWDRLRDGEE
jgi:hypothetical protein